MSHRERRAGVLVQAPIAQASRKRRLVYVALWDGKFCDAIYEQGVYEA